MHRSARRQDGRGKGHRQKVNLNEFIVKNAALVRFEGTESELGAGLILTEAAA